MRLLVACDQNRHRYYNEEDIAILKYIVVMKYAHFSLAEIKSMIELFRNEPSEECNETGKQILITKITELKKMIYSYQHIVALMEELLPLVDDIDTCLDNDERIDGFVEQIFNDIPPG